MTTIPQREPRDRMGSVLRRAEAGEELVISVRTPGGGPAHQRRWVRGPALDRIWETPAPETLADDLGRFPAGPTDPFAP